MYFNFTHIDDKIIKAAKEEERMSEKRTFSKYIDA